ncbi:MAG: VWA domain-containing protein [Clostridiales bacterium]|nr:VWA domain-containing protein [Clostridiales bacterium]
MKKLISRVIVVVLVVSSFTGCSKKNEEKSAPDITYTNQAPTQAINSSEYQYGVKEEQFNFDSGTSDMTCDITEESYVPPVEYNNTEEYRSIVENGYQTVKNNPLSTFSIDVDTASYSNVRRMLTDGYYFDKDAVRLEEMINYFSYDYQEPSDGEPFSINTELADCPWNKDSKLLLIGLKGQTVEMPKMPASNLVFLIDVSGSMMDYDKLPLVQQAFGLLTEKLTEKDRVSIVTYASGDAVVLEGANGIQKDKIMNAINNLYASGSTAGSAGIQTAYEIAEKYFIPNGNNRVILATDGDLNVGITSESGLEQLITEKKESGVYLSVLGFGTQNIKDNKMEILADKGNGNYSYIDSIREAKKVLVDEMGATLVTIAEDVKLQLEFNPKAVREYRLVGYENRVLNAEDFEDDTKDAGEIGSGHTVTALYEVVLNDSKKSVPALKYQPEKEEEVESNQNADELLTISIRYKKPGQDSSKLLSKVVLVESLRHRMPKNMNFASAVAEFGMLLRDSEYKGTASYDGILEQLRNSDIEGDVYREEFVELVKLARDRSCGLYE